MQQPTPLAKPRMFEFISSSSKLGIKIGFAAAALYLLLLSCLPLQSLMYLAVSEDARPLSELITAFVTNGILIWIYGIMFGFLPTLLFGGITGALLGALVYQTHTRFSKLVLSIIASVICALIIAITAVIVVQVGDPKLNSLIWYFIPPAVIYIVIAGPATAYIYHRLESYQEL
jgi:hypothetical protein